MGPAMLTNRTVAASIRARYGRVTEAAAVEAASPGLDVETAYAEVTTATDLEGLAGTGDALSAIGTATCPDWSTAAADRGGAGLSVIQDLKLEVADVRAEPVHENEVFNAIL